MAKGKDLSGDFSTDFMVIERMKDDLLSEIESQYRAACRLYKVIEEAFAHCTLTLDKEDIDALVAAFNGTPEYRIGNVDFVDAVRGQLIKRFLDLDGFEGFTRDEEEGEIDRGRMMGGPSSITSC